MQTNDIVKVKTGDQAGRAGIIQRLADGADVATVRLDAVQDGTPELTADFALVDLEFIGR